MRIAPVVLVLLLACGTSRAPAPSGTAAPAAASPASSDSSAGDNGSGPAGAPAVPASNSGIAKWRALPADRPFLVERVSGAGETRCAVSKAGEVACWGRIDPDGNGPAEHRRGVGTPLLLEGISDAIAVKPYWFFICVAQKSGAGGCVQTHDLKQATPQFPQPPVQFGEANFRLCARMRDGRVGCLEPRGNYEQIAGIEGATDLRCAGNACCATTPSGLRCFGQADDDLGIVESMEEAKPVKDAVPPANELALTHSGACVRKPDGGAHCWGDAAKLSRRKGVRRVVATREDVCLILDGGAMVCASERTAVGAEVTDVSGDCRVHRDGGVSCEGFNQYGELGDGHVVLSTAPLRVGTFDDIVDLRVSHTSSCALRKGGTMWCWGSGPLEETSQYGPKGDLMWGQYAAGCRLEGTLLHCQIPDHGGSWDRRSFDLRGAAAAPKTVAIDRDSSICVVGGNGKVKCRFGMAENGIDDRWTPLAAPAPVAELRPISTGFCALHTDGRASCFVDDRYDDDPDFLEQLPKGSLKLVPGIAGATQIATGQGDACVITKTAQVWCWGEHRKTPYELPSLRGATWIAGGHLHGCAIVRGEVWCWGDNQAGQLGDGTVGRRIDRSPTPVRAKLPVPAVRVGVGRDSTCALDDRGRVWCWGADSYGELGQGRLLRTEQPVRIVGLGPKK